MNHISLNSRIDITDNEMIITDRHGNQVELPHDEAYLLGVWITRYLGSSE